MFSIWKFEYQTIFSLSLLPTSSLTDVKELNWSADSSWQRRPPPPRIPIIRSPFNVMGEGVGWTCLCIILNGTEEREKERERVRGKGIDRQTERDSVCLCVIESEREYVCVFVREREGESERGMEIKEDENSFMCERKKISGHHRQSARYNSMYIFCLIRNSSFLLTFYDSVFFVWVSLTLEFYVLRER